MKKSKLMVITGILGIVLICLISFLGIYVQKLNKMENIIKDFNYSKDLKGYREIIFKLSDSYKVLDEKGVVVGDTSTITTETMQQNKYVKSEEKVNSQDLLTAENFEKTKKFFEGRLKALGVEDYNISVNKKTGEIYIQIPEDSNTNTVVSNISEVGSVEIKDSESGETLIKSENFKKALATYGSTSTGTVAGIELQFDNEGTEILKNLSQNEYKTLNEEEKTETNDDNTSDTEEQNEEGNEEEKKTEEENNNEESKNDSEQENESNTQEENKNETKQKEIAIYISGAKAISKSFDQPVLNGKISDLSIGQPTTDNEILASNMRTASTIVGILNNGPLPLKYEQDENQYVETDISMNNIKLAIIIVSVCIAILLLYMVIKFKLRGIIYAIAYVGFIGLYLLLLKYANVVISLEGIVGIIIIAILNYYISMKLLEVEKDNNTEYDKKFLNLLIKCIPLLCVSIVFCFIKITMLKSLGMVTFWGILLMLAYNRVIKHIID